jgi:hypothetical protein
MVPGARVHSISPKIATSPAFNHSDRIIGPSFGAATVFRMAAE